MYEEYALRSGVDSTSSGTRVVVVEHSGNNVTVYPASGEVDQDIYLETTYDNLVQLRNRTDVVPKLSGYQRRAAAGKHHLIDGVHSPRSPVKNF